MNIKDKDKEHFSECDTNKRYKIKENKTTLFYSVKNKCFLVKVDNGIIQDNSIKKCDWLFYDENNLMTHLIELKGKIINDAFEQLESTVDKIKESDYPMLLQNLKILDAYIVSPNITYPRDIESKKRKLAKKLYSRCGEKPVEMSELIHFIDLRITKNICI